MASGDGVPALPQPAPVAMQHNPSPQPERLSVRVHDDRAEISAVETRLLEMLDRFGYGKASRFAVRLAVEEALTNAFRHGHRGLPRDAAVLLEVHVGPETVTICVEDEGPGFVPESVPDPTLDENLDKPTGRGLMLMRAYMASIEYNARGNRVTLTYLRPKG